MAAYHGNIERYLRLRRPRPISGELDCCVRGVYHSTAFAVFWSNKKTHRFGASRLDAAIEARNIMNNILTSGPSEEPYLIWHPSLADPSTFNWSEDGRKCSLKS